MMTIKIAYTYTDTDGTQVDVIEVTNSDGTTQRRQAWTLSNPSGKPSFVVQGGDDEWVSHYKRLWIKRVRMQCYG